MNKFLNIDEGMKRWGSDSEVNKLKKDKHKEKPAKKTKKNPVNLFKDTFTRRLVICFVCFVALRPKSTAMVIAGRSVHLTTLFPGQA